MTIGEGCGYSCTEELEKIRDYCSNLNDFAKINKEYAIVMYGKAIEILFEEHQRMLKEEIRRKMKEEENTS